MSDELQQLPVPRRLAAARATRRAFSLMEVLFALAILVGAMTMLGELISLGNRNAIAARDLSQAQMFCQSKLNEIRAGLVEAAAVSNAAIETDPDWLYSIETGQTDEVGILSVSVTVSQNLPSQQAPITFTLVAWITDPSVVAAEQPIPTETQPATTTEATSAASATETPSQ